MIAGPGRVAVCGDAPTLRSKLDELADIRFGLVISWGLCGGLDPHLRPGDLILGAEVASPEGRIIADEGVTSTLARRLTDAGAPVAIESVAGVSSPVATARAKADTRAATRAAVVDMESLIAGRFALERRTPFAILRAVSDPADRDLPPLVFRAMDSEGRIRTAAVARELLRSPRQFPGLVAAAQDSRAAFDALGRCRGLPGLFLGLGPAHV